MNHRDLFLGFLAGLFTGWLGWRPKPAPPAPPVDDSPRWVQTRQAGHWQDPATWQGGRVPRSQDFAYLHHDVDVSGLLEVRNVHASGLICQ